SARRCAAKRRRSFIKPWQAGPAQHRPSRAGTIPPKAVWSETVFVRDVLRVDERLPNAAPRTSSHAVAAHAYLPPGRSGALQAEAATDGLEESAPAECPHDDPPQNRPNSTCASTRSAIGLPKSCQGH